MVLNSASRVSKTDASSSVAPNQAVHRNKDKLDGQRKPALVRLVVKPQRRHCNRPAMRSRTVLRKPPTKWRGRGLFRRFCRISFNRSALLHRARKSIEHEPVLAVKRQPIFDQLDNNLVGDQSALLRNLIRLQSRAAFPRSRSRRRIVPGEVTGIAKCRVIISACVPFPEPGAPRSTMRLFT